MERPEEALSEGLEGRWREISVKLLPTGSILFLFPDECLSSPPEGYGASPLRLSRINSFPGESGGAIVGRARNGRGVGVG